MKPPDYSGRPAPASPFPVANPAQAARPGRNTARIPPGCDKLLRVNPLQKKGLRGWPSSERIRRLMNSPGWGPVNGE